MMTVITTIITVPVEECLLFQNFILIWSSQLANHKLQRINIYCLLFLENAITI